jgi:hypothetical protein
MERLSLLQCRNLIPPGGKPLSDEEVLGLRDMLYCLGGVISDAFSELNNIDQSEFEPYGGAVDQLNELNGGY